MRSGPNSAERSAAEGPVDCLERLARWNEAGAGERAALAEHAAACSTCGPGLALIERAEAWLEERLAQGAGPSPCPPAEELYDHGGGPGARPLAAAVRERVAEHLERCAECRGFVATLAARPPAPLADLPRSPSDFVRAPLAALPRPSAPALRPRWAAAAALFLAVAGWLALRPAEPAQAGAELELARAPQARGRYPELPLLRGAESAGALFPRGRVLAGPGQPACALRRFEIAPVAGASGYRAVLRSTQGGAFEAGAVVARLSGEQAQIEAADVFAKLAPGHYTWEAWALVHGLERPLGERDFELARDPELERELAEIERASAPGDAPYERLARLFEAGYASDARALAQSLPETPERERFLDGQIER